jgi:hypothetical protein
MVETWADPEPPFAWIDAILDRISSVASLVNVVTRSRQPASARRAARRVTTLVLPLPGPAYTAAGPSSCINAARCSGLKLSQLPKLQAPKLPKLTIRIQFGSSANYSSRARKRTTDGTRRHFISTCYYGVIQTCMQPCTYFSFRRICITESGDTFDNAASLTLLGALCYTSAALLGNSHSGNSQTGLKEVALCRRLK